MTIIVKKLDKTLFCDSYNNYIRNLLLILSRYTRFTSNFLYGGF